METLEGEFIEMIIQILYTSERFQFGIMGYIFGYISIYIYKIYKFINKYL